MKKLLNIIIILAFIPLLNAQFDVSKVIFGSKIVSFQGRAVSHDPLSVGRILYLRASTISEDSLTYNSTGDLVTGSSGVNVDLDGSSEVLIGNSVRFGNPTTGTIYQIVDTGATAANLILDQTFTGSITDEFYCGGVNTWYDESGENYNAIQSTGINQPKLIWVNTDSAEVNLDGSNSNLYITDFNALDSYVTVYSCINPKTFGEVGNGNIIGNGKLISFITSAGSRLNLANTGTTAQISGNNSIVLNTCNNTVSTRTNTGVTNFYIDGVISGTPNQSGETPVAGTTDLFIGDRSTGNRAFEGGISKISIYSRILTITEIQILSQ